MDSHGLGLRPEDVQDITLCLSREPEVEKALIFGSRAKGNPKRGSDVDIALFGPRLDSRTVSRISDWLNEETPLPYHVDVLLFQHIMEPALREHILRVGQIIYERESENPAPSCS